MDFKKEQQDALSEDNMTAYINAKAGELMDLMERKHDQYANDDDLANFRAGALLHSGSGDYYDMYEESKAYCRKHIAHVYGKDKLMESLGDIVVYSLIQMYMVEKHYMLCREMLEE